jgi:serine/threonine protein phosphatase PrpC
MADAGTYDISVKDFLEIDAVAIVGARSEQQDAFGCAQVGTGSVILALADGMGGHAGGQTASREAIQNFVGSFVDEIRRGSSLDVVFDHAVDNANASIARASAADRALNGLGTTLVGAFLSPEGLAWVSVGDSILWVWHKGLLLRLNDDHSLREVVGKKGAKDGNLLLSALTGGEIAIVDRKPAPISLSCGDVVILASDGVLSISDNALADILKASRRVTAATIADNIIQAVVAVGKPTQDNTTVVVARVLKDAPGRRNGDGGQEALHRPFQPALLVGISLASALLTSTATCLAYYLLRRF